MKKAKQMDESGEINLSLFWWHRLLKVIYIFLFIVALGVSVMQISDSQFTKYAKVGMLSDRIDSNIRKVGDLVKSDEKIAINEGNLYETYNGNSLYEKNGGWLLKQEYYCSKNIADQVENITSKTGVNYYKGNLDLVSLNEFKGYLNQNNAKCVQVLDLDSVSRYGEVKKALSWGLETDNMAVWKVSTIKSIVSTVQTIFLVILAFIIVRILYYKVFLYIVFGTKKIKK